MKNSWFAFKNIDRDNDVVDISIHDEIGSWGISAKDFIIELKEYSGYAIDLSIHSPGGSVFDGWAIFNALLMHNGAINVTVEGLAASMASAIAMAGDKAPVMHENSMLMIHNPWTIAMGDADELKKTASLLEKMQDNFTSIYGRHANITDDEILDIMSEETWLTGKEAQGLGLASEVLPAREIAAKLDASILVDSDIQIPDSAKCFVNLDRGDAESEEKSILEKMYNVCLNIAKNTNPQKPKSKRKETDMEHREEAQDTVEAFNAGYEKAKAELEEKLRAEIKAEYEDSVKSLEEALVSKEDECKKFQSSKDKAETEVDKLKEQLQALTGGTNFEGEGAKASDWKEALDEFDGDYSKAAKKYPELLEAYRKSQS